MFFSFVVSSYLVEYHENIFSSTVISEFWCHKFHGGVHVWRRKILLSAHMLFSGRTINSLAYGKRGTTRSSSNLILRAPFSFLFSYAACSRFTGYPTDYQGGEVLCHTNPESWWCHAVLHYTTKVIQRCVQLITSIKFNGTCWNLT